MIYGDGSFKDSVGKIWELADPVVSPAYTSGLEGVPNETKLKYLADNNFAHLRGDALKEAISEHIKNRDLQEEKDRKSTRLNSSHVAISYAVFCLKKKNNSTTQAINVRIIRHTHFV